MQHNLPFTLGKLHSHFRPISAIEVFASQRIIFLQAAIQRMACRGF
jgi:hypothetical protein